MSILHGCPSCASPLVQPHSWRDAAGALLLAVSCPDCWTCTRVECSAEELSALDRLQRTRHRELRAAYERCVAESMEALAECLAEALALDLIGADDFRPPAAA